MLSMLVGTKNSWVCIASLACLVRTSIFVLYEVLVLFMYPYSCVIEIVALWSNMVAYHACHAQHPRSCLACLWLLCGKWLYYHLSDTLRPNMDRLVRYVSAWCNWCDYLLACRAWLSVDIKDGMCKCLIVIVILSAPLIPFHPSHSQHPYILINMLIIHGNLWTWRVGRVVPGMTGVPGRLLGVTSGWWGPLPPVYGTNCWYCTIIIRPTMMLRMFYLSSIPTTSFTTKLPVYGSIKGKDVVPKWNQLSRINIDILDNTITNNGHIGT